MYRHAVLFAALAVAAVASPASAADVSRLWKLHDLPAPAGWREYSGPDTWPGVIGEGAYTLPLKPALPAGKYRVQVRTLNVAKLELRVDTARVDVPVVRDAFSKPVEVELKVAATGLTLTGSGVLQAVNVTSKLTEELGPEGVAVRAATPSPAAVTIPPPPVPTGNVLENSSFEVGPGHGWGRIWTNQLDDRTAADGRWSLRLPVQPHFVGHGIGWVYRVNGIDGVETKFYRLPPGKYTLSASFKADRPCRVALGVRGHPVPGQGGDGPIPEQQPVEVTTEWKRVSFPVNVPDGPGNFWCVYVAGEWRAINYGLSGNATLEEVRKANLKDIPAVVWLDAVQFERADTATAYKPRRPLEVGVRCDQPGHILYENEPADVRLLVYNPERRRGSVEVEYRIENYQDAPVASQKLTVPLTGEPNVSVPLPVPLDRRGIFRLLVWVSGDAVGKEELVYSVLPPNPHLTAFHAAGRMGADARFIPEPLAVLKRAGCAWVIHKYLGRMENAQPQVGKFVWNDDEVKYARDAKLHVLGQVYTNDAPEYLRPFLPNKQGWDPEKKKRYLEIWGKYVTDLVTHYKDTIRHWEVTNEPYFWSTPEDHAAILKVASEAIRRVDPGIQVIGFCSANMPRYFPRAVRAADPAWYDGVSGHFYDSNPVTLRQLAGVLSRQKKTGWQTEAGPTFPSFYTTLPTLAQLRREHNPADAEGWMSRETTAVNTIQTELRCFGIGRIDHYFHYFSRFTNCSPTEPTRRAGNGKEDVEYDGSLRPYAVARAVASRFLDGATPHAEWRGDPALTALLFAKGGGTVGVFWSQQDRPLRVSPGGTAGWAVHDWFGNKLAEPVGFAVDRFPRYVVAPVPPERVMKALDRGTVGGKLDLDARLAVVPGAPGVALDLFVRSGSDREETFTLEFGGVFGGYVRAAEGTAKLTLKPREQRRVRFPLIGAPTRQRPLVVQANGADGFRAAFPLRFVTAEAVNAPDGKGLEKVALVGFTPDEIRGGAGNRMGDPDFNPAFRVGYDALHLYMVVEVTDDLLSPAGEPADGRHDQVRIDFAALTPERAKAADPREVAARVPSASDVAVVATLTGERSVVVVLRPRGGPARKLDGATVERTKDGYKLLLRVPWEMLRMPAPRPGGQLAFNVTAFDADGVNPDHKTDWPWAGGPDGDPDNPRTWGELLFR